MHAAGQAAGSVVSAGEVSGGGNGQPSAPAIVDHLRDAVIVTDAEFRIEAWNAGAERVYGYTAAEATGRIAGELLRGEYFEPPKDAADILRRTGHWAGEVAHRRADGALVHVLSSVTLLRGAEGEPTGAVAVNRPLADVPGASHFHDALAAGRTATWEWDAQSDALEWSDNGPEVHGVPADRRGASWRAAFDAVHPDDRDRILADAAAAIDGTGSFSSEYRVIDHAGETRWLLCRARAMHGEDGGLTRIVGTVTDVTDRHRVEDALRVTEERLRTVVAHAPIVLFAFDGSGRVTLAEGAALPASGAHSLAPDAAILAHVARVLKGESFRADVELNGVVFDTWYQPLVDEQGAVTGGFGVSTDVTQRRRAEMELAHQAVHDPLTGLPNRLLFLDRLAVAVARGRRRGSVTAVLFLDLDRFKLVNDSHGHGVGDEVLMLAAERLQSLVRPSDTIARFGGDEFVVLCEDLVGELEAVGIAERIVDGLRHPIQADGVEVYLSTSVGIALAEGGEQTPEDLIRDADVAMYRAKESGRARWELFDTHMRERAVRQLALRNGLHGVVDRGELRLHFQPVVRLADGAMRGAEALVRWEHPDYGLLPPVHFLSVAEDAGLIRGIGQWVLGEACRQVTRWNRLVRPALVVSVNLGVRQLLDPALVDDVRKTLADTGTDPGHLCLEVSEGALLDDGERVVEVLAALADLGVHLAIDDFGAGQTALGALRLLPVDILKMDRALAQGLRDERGVAVVQSVVGLGHALGFKVVAEGVETAGQAERLADLGCDLAQGYFLGRPDEAGSISGLVARG